MLLLLMIQKGLILFLIDDKVSLSSFHDKQKEIETNPQKNQMLIESNTYNTPKVQETQNNFLNHKIFVSALYHH